MITVAEARTLIFRDAAPGPIETTSLLRGLGKVLAEPVLAPSCLPPFDHAAVEGVAVRSGDLTAAEPGMPVRLSTMPPSANGPGAVVELAPGSVCRVAAGAPLPLGADAVVRAEAFRGEGGRAVFSHPVEPGENVRRSGADLREGDRVLEAGTVLTPACVALLAGCGVMDVKVHAAPRVAILTVSDERVPPGHLLGSAQPYDSSAFALAAMVSEAGGIPLLLGGLWNDREHTLLQLREAATHDVILISGGRAGTGLESFGDLLERHGELHVDRVAHQPGMPFTYATLWEKPVFTLPAHPDSSLLCFEVYVRPLLRMILGQRELERPRLWVTMAEAFAKPPGKEAFFRVILDRTTEGTIAHLTESAESQLPTGLARPSALVFLPADVAGLAAGERVEALSLASLN